MRPLSQTMASRLALKPRAALIMFQMWIALWWWCTQITINPGRSLQLPAEAALLCKDWLLQYVMRRSEGAVFDEQRARILPSSSAIKCCLWGTMTRTLLPSHRLVPRPCLACQGGYHQYPFNHCSPVFVEPI